MCGFECVQNWYCSFQNFPRSLKRRLCDRTRDRDEIESQLPTILCGGIGFVRKWQCQRRNAIIKVNFTANSKQKKNGIHTETDVHGVRA